MKIKKFKETISAILLILIVVFWKELSWILLLLFVFSIYKNTKDNTQGKKNKNHRKISSNVRKEVWNRDEGKCVRCGSREKLEYDHIIPFSKGGSNTARNIELLCEKCNRSKGAKIDG